MNDVFHHEWEGLWAVFSRTDICNGKLLHATVHIT